MNLKRYTIIVSIVFSLSVAAGYLSGQGAAPAGSSISFAGGTGLCDTPAPNKIVLCGTSTTTPATLLISVNGAPFASIQGTPGPAGTPGPRGDQGPQGIQGIAGTGGTVTLNGKTCTATFDGMTQDGKGSGGFIVHLGTCQ